MRPNIEAYQLKGEQLAAYRAGFWNGNESHYAPGTYSNELWAIYDWGYRDGQQYGPRQGKPWTIAELMKFNGAASPSAG